MSIDEQVSIHKVKNLYLELFLSSRKEIDDKKIEMIRHLEQYRRFKFISPEFKKKIDKLLSQFRDV